MDGAGADGAAGVAGAVFRDTEPHQRSVTLWLKKLKKNMM